MGFDVLDVHKRLKLCPFCGKQLEIHPCAGTKSCFWHGDFILRQENNGSITIAFRLINL